MLKMPKFLMFCCLILVVYNVVFVESDLISVDESKYTFKFSQSTSSLVVWTAPATYRVTSQDTTAPTATGGTLYISCAKEEFESFQLIIAPTTLSSLTVSVSGFSSLGDTWDLDIGVATFSTASSWGQGSYSVTDYTNEISNGGSVTLSSSRPSVIWFTLYVPEAGTQAGTTSATITLTSGSTVLTLSVQLYVFDFVLDITPHFDTFMMSQPTITVYELDELDAWKKVYLQHRMSYPDPAWPGYTWKQLVS